MGIGAPVHACEHETKCLYEEGFINSDCEAVAALIALIVGEGMHYFTATIAIALRVPVYIISHSDRFLLALKISCLANCRQ
jgi:hypothetical protein